MRTEPVAFGQHDALERPRATAAAAAHFLLSPLAAHARRVLGFSKTTSVSPPFDGLISVTKAE